MVVMAWGHVGVIDNGGIALEESYPYLMQDAWCLKTDRSSGVKVHFLPDMSLSEVPNS